MSQYTRFPDPAAGIKVYPSVTSFPVSAKDGAQAVAADTNTIYIFDTATNTWVAVATPGAAIAIDGLIDDVLATGPGVASATVVSVGGAAAADIATSVSDTQAATDAATASTLVKRDSNADSSFNQVNAAYFVSSDPVISLTASYNTGLQVLDVATNASTTVGQNFVTIYNPAIPSSASLTEGSLVLDSPGAPVYAKIQSTPSPEVDLQDQSNSYQARMYVYPNPGLDLTRPGNGNSILTDSSLYIISNAGTAAASIDAATTTVNVEDGNTGLRSEMIPAQLNLYADKNAPYYLNIDATSANTVNFRYFEAGGPDVYYNFISNTNPNVHVTSGTLKADVGGGDSIEMFPGQIQFQNSTGGVSLSLSPLTSSNYPLVLPPAQGGAGEFLQNDGSGNLSWAAAGGGLPAQTGNANKVLATDGSSASWQYAGLGAGSLGTSNVIVGRGKPGNLTGTETTIVGDQAGFSIASSTEATTIGFQADVTGIGGTALGSKSSAGLVGTSLGRLALSGTESVAVGHNAQIAANAAVVVGGQSGGTGQYTVALGYGAKVNGNDNISIGYVSGTGASGINNIFIGSYAGISVTGNNNVILGNINTATLSDTIILAAGSAERIRINSSGNMGIGTTTPAQKLDVNGTAQATAFKVPNYILSPQLFDAGTKTANFSLDLGANGPCQQVTINAAGPLVLTLSNPVTGGAYLLKLVQGATTGTITFPANVKWGAAGAPTLSSTTGLIDIINLYYDGTDYYGTYALGF